MTIVENQWQENQHVALFTSLSDLNQPYTCAQWGNLGGGDFEPLIIYDESDQFMNWFGCCGSSVGWPSTVFLNHDMEVHFKGNYMGAFEINYVIEQLLEECGDDCIVPPPMALFTYEINELSVSFIDLSISETSNIIEWNWDFGDGNNSSEQFPIHTYESDGSYFVTLDVVDQYGAEGIQYWENIDICSDGILDECGICNGVGPSYFCEVNDQYYCSENEMNNNCFLGSKSDLKNNYSIINVYPNPFNPLININYRIDVQGAIKIDIINIHGEFVDNLENDFKSPGSYYVSWDGSSYSSGVYLIKIKYKNQLELHKIILLK